MGTEPKKKTSKKLKRLVRARMKETGENYTTALAALRRKREEELAEKAGGPTNAKS